MRSIGSGNIGATNVLRTGRKGLAAATLVFDVLKATLAVVFAWWALDRQRRSRGGRRGPRPYVSALAQVSGRQGRCDLLGCLIGLAWPAAVVFALVWLAVAALTRYSSAAALAATVASPIAVAAIGESGAALVFAALSALIWFKHSANIVRLLNGSESKIGQKN